MEDLIAERSFDSKDTWVSDVLGLFLFDMLSIDVCTTRHGQTFGWLVQELDIGTVLHQMSSSRIAASCLLDINILLSSSSKPNSGKKEIGVYVTFNSLGHIVTR